MTDEDWRLIPTAFRVRISKELSFPIGSELISRALWGIPGYEGLQLHFVAYADRANPSRVREMAQDDEPLNILEIWGNSDIWVYPVPRENKSVVREVLCGVGLPRLREWLVEYGKGVHKMPDRLRRRSCTLSVCVADATFYFSEREFQMPQRFKRRRQ